MQEQNEQMESRWQKIGQHGDLLNFDALHWAAAVDTKTKLMWAINPSKTADFPNPHKRKKWLKANEWVEKVNKKGWCGFSDWRLPTIEECESLIVENKQPNLYIREDIFNDINYIERKQHNVYLNWSSSLSSIHAVWVIRFGDDYGYDGCASCPSHISAYHYVRLVRSSQ